MTYNRFKKVISTIMAVTIAFTGLTLGAPSYAASNKPSSTSITSVKAINNGFTVKWKKKSCTGYQIQYSTSKKFAKNGTKVLKVNKAKTTSKTVKKLKAKKKYYVRVRTYKTVKKKNYYSKWTKSYNVTTKKAKSSSSGNSSNSSSSSSSAPTIKSISYLDKGYGFKLSWNKYPNAYGYEIQYSTDKNFKNIYDKNGNLYYGVSKEVGKNATSVSWKIDENDTFAEETWYIRIRALKNQPSLNTKAKYTNWSTVSIISPEKQDFINIMNNDYEQMGITANDSEFDKLVKIQNWIDHNWYYDNITEYNDASGTYQLAKHYNNGCNSFAAGFNYFANKAGIQSYTIGGSSTNPNRRGHYWNWINIEGYWYSYDCEVYTPNNLFDANHKPMRFLKYDFVGNSYVLDAEHTDIYVNSNPKADKIMINNMVNRINSKLYT